jgi:hypothetical protein
MKPHDRTYIARFMGKPIAGPTHDWNAVLEAACDHLLARKGHQGIVVMSEVMADGSLVKLTSLTNSVNLEHLRDLASRRVLSEFV